MIFNTKELNPYTRKHFNGADESDGFIDLRIMPDGERKKLTKLAFKEKVEYKKGGRFEFLDDAHPKDPDFFDRNLWDYCIGSWGDVLSEDDKFIETTAENKLMLMNGSPVFKAMVQKYLTEIKEEEIAHDKAKAKNE